MNLFMYTGVDREQRPRIYCNRSRPGDRIELVALIDLLAIPNVCADDIWPTSNFDQRPVRVAVHRGGADLLSRLRLGDHADGLRHRRPARGQVVAVHRVRGFKPQFEPFAPGRVEVEVDLTREDRELVDALMDAGAGATAGEVLRACFLLWRTQVERAPIA